jgi:hypothetical protein
MRISFMAETFVKKFDRKCRMVMMAIRGISFSLSRVLALRSCCLGVAVKPQFVLSARDVRVYRLCSW